MKRLEIEPTGGMYGTVYSKSVEGYRVDWIHSDAYYEGITLDAWLKLSRDMNGMFKGHAQHK